MTLISRGQIRLHSVLEHVQESKKHVHTFKLTNAKGIRRKSDRRWKSQ